MMAEFHELRWTKGTYELERVSLATMTALAGPVPLAYRTFFAGWDASLALLAWSAKLLLPFLVGDMTLTTLNSDDEEVMTKAKMMAPSSVKEVAS